MPRPPGRAPHTLRRVLHPVGLNRGTVCVGTTLSLSPTCAARPSRRGQTTEEEQAQWRMWQLRDRCLRVATYYRIQHMQRKAARRERKLRVQVALRAWARRTLEATRQQQHRETAKRARDPITYKETPTRKQRATPEEMIIRANRKRTRIQTTTAAETGRRLMAMITETAERVKRQRTMETRKRLRIDEAEAG